MESSRSSKLKERLARMFRSPSLLRSPCKPSASAATNLSSAASTRALFDDAVHEPVFVPRRRGGSLDDHLGRSFSSTVPTVAVGRRRSVDCSGCRPTCAVECSQPAPLVAKNKKWRDLKARKKERRVRETGGYYETGEWEGRTCPPASPSSPSKSSYYYYCFNGDVKEEKEGIKRKKKKKKKKKKKRVPSNSYRFSSSSSMESDVQEDGFFSSEEREGKEEETETFFSSRSFSSDSSEFYQRPTSKEKNKNKNKRNPERPQRRRARKYEAWGVCKGFQPLVSITRREKKGFAVVKRSSDPYNDFRSSMLEMITERQIFGAEDLECLLQSYLSLNSPHLHPLILQAFSDIWVVLFGH